MSLKFHVIKENENENGKTTQQKRRKYINKKN